ncbi:MAG: heat-inducible transcriptional repressor HrcA, partial [Pseudonocardiaceae bacterium]
TPVELRDAMTRASTVLIETLVEHPEERLLLGGTANLTRNATDFPGSLRQVLEALEEQVVVLKLLAAARDPGTITVRIGEENEAEEMRSTSLVSIGYASHGTVLGGMGVVGPTRMDYPGTIAAVRAVARYVGEILTTR